MADISMCADALCPSAPKCKRSALSGTIPSYWQAMHDYRRPQGLTECDDIWPVKQSNVQETE